MTLNLILVECGLELIPKYIRDHPAIKKNLNQKNYSSQLLDNALHHSAMKKLPNYEKRGRPDLVHSCLLNALSSPLNKKKGLRLYFHTYQDRIFEINPEIKITRNFNRFKGLMAKLLIEGEIKYNNTVLILELDQELSSLIDSFENREVILLSEKGITINDFTTLFQNNSSKNYIILIGGFQKSNFSEKILKLSNNVVSISQYSLDAWVVVSKIITYYEIINEIY